jgi:hypothetical protein
VHARVLVGYAAEGSHNIRVVELRGGNLATVMNAQDCRVTRGVTERNYERCNAEGRERSVTRAAEVTLGLICHSTSIAACSADR